MTPAGYRTPTEGYRATEIKPGLFAVTNAYSGDYQFFKGRPIMAWSLFGSKPEHTYKVENCGTEPLYIGPESSTPVGVLPIEPKPSYPSTWQVTQEMVGDLASRCVWTGKKIPGADKTPPQLPANTVEIDGYDHLCKRADGSIRARYDGGRWSLEDVLFPQNRIRHHPETLRQCEAYLAEQEAQSTPEAPVNGYAETEDTSTPEPEIRHYHVVVDDEPIDPVDAAVSLMDAYTRYVKVCGKAGESPEQFATMLENVDTFLTAFYPPIDDDANFERDTE